MLHIFYYQSKFARVGNLLVCSLLFALSLKTTHRLTVSYSLFSLFKKERLWAKFSSCSLKREIVSKSLFGSLQNTKEQPWVNRSLKKSEMSDLLMIQVNHSRNPAVPLKKFILCVCFWQFFTAFPFFMPKIKSLQSLFV